MNMKLVVMLVFVLMIGVAFKVKDYQEQYENAKVTPAGPVTAPGDSIIIDHTCTDLGQIPAQWIDRAIAGLHITYGHTSHGSQITTGLLGLSQFKGKPYIYNKTPSAGTLDLRDNPFYNGKNIDLGQPDNKTWAAETRRYLETHPDINVVMWSWCGQLSSASEKSVNTYLQLMQALEADFPGITFIYMTGHLDGTGENGTLAKNNKIIRDFCTGNGKVLFDFADIESYNPDGVYFGDKYANDACEYDSDGDKKADRNWATEWQDRHVKGVDWFDCAAAHSQPVNANMKAYAAWWLMARLAGWDGKALAGAA
jgi:hypothetical protein